MHTLIKCSDADFRKEELRKGFLELNLLLSNSELHSELMITVETVDNGGIALPVETYRARPLSPLIR